MPTTRDNFNQVLEHSNTCSRPSGPRITDMRCADITGAPIYRMPGGEFRDSGASGKPDGLKMGPAPKIAWRAASPSLTTGPMTACRADLTPSQEA